MECPKTSVHKELQANIHIIQKINIGTTWRPRSKYNIQTKISKKKKKKYNYRDFFENSSKFPPKIAFDNSPLHIIHMRQ